MDKDNGAGAVINFPVEVRNVLGSTLASRDFILDQVDDGVDEGGRPLCVVYYRGVDTKIQVYESSREGEINGMIAPLSAPNEFGLRSEPPVWQFISRFEHRSHSSFADMLRRASAPGRGDNSQLLRVKSRIESNFEVARALILTTGRTGTLLEDLSPIHQDQTGLAGRIAVLLASLPERNGVLVNLKDTDPVVIVDDAPGPSRMLRVHPLGDPHTVIDVDHAQLALAPTLK